MIKNAIPFPSSPFLLLFVVDVSKSCDFILLSIIGFGNSLLCTMQSINLDKGLTLIKFQQLIFFKLGGCDFLGNLGVVAQALSIFVSCSIHYFDTKKPSNSLKIQYLYYLTLPTPLNIKPYSRTFQNIINNPNLVQKFLRSYIIKKLQSFQIYKVTTWHKDSKQMLNRSGFVL